MDLESSVLAEVPTVEDTSKSKEPAKKRAKKSSWTYEETMSLINIMGTESVQKKFDGMVHNHKVWQDVAAQLNTRHNAEKCHDKWTYLKQRYREIKKNNSSTGRGRQSFMFFDEMNTVLGLYIATHAGLILLTYPFRCMQDEHGGPQPAHGHTCRIWQS